MSFDVKFQGANGSALGGEWTTQSVASGGGVGTDTFTQQAGNARISCAADNGSEQFVKFSGTRAQHSSSLDITGTITWSNVTNETTVFMVRSDLVTSAGANFCNNNYIFEFDTTSDVVNLYKVIAGTPLNLTGYGGGVAFTYVAATTYSYRLVLTNYFLGFKLWTGGEPGGYNTSYTDPDGSISAATIGKFAWGNNHGVASTSTIDIGPMTFTSNLEASIAPAVRPARR